jgi:hypothetical protein
MGDMKILNGFDFVTYVLPKHDCEDFEVTKYTCKLLILNILPA